MHNDNTQQALHPNPCNSIHILHLKNFRQCIHEIKQKKNSATKACSKQQAEYQHLHITTTSRSNRLEKHFS